MRRVRREAFPELNFCCSFISSLEERRFNHESDSPGSSIFLLSYLDTRLSVSFCNFLYPNISNSTRKWQWLELNNCACAGVISLHKLMCPVFVCLRQCLDLCLHANCGLNSWAQVCVWQFALSLLAHPTNNWSANWTWELFHVSTCVPG